MSFAPGPRVGIWGPFDLPDFGNLLAPRIFEHELLRRLPHARIYPYAPLGAEHPIGMDGGRPATPLGSWTPARLAQLAEQLDLVAVAGSDVIHLRDDLHRQAYAETAPEAVAELEPSRFFVDGLGAELESRCPVVWHAVGVPFEFGPDETAHVREALASKRYVSVGDPSSGERLLATGTEQEVALVPDPVVLVSRLFPADTIERRLRYLRAVGSYPADERPIIVQGNAALAEEVEPAAAALSEAADRDPRLSIVLVALAPARGDQEFADALAARLRAAVHRMPAEITLEDLVAALANARAFVGSSPHGYLTAQAFGVPGVLVTDLQELSAAITALLRGEVAVDTAASPSLDEHFDKLARIAEQSWSARLESQPGGAAAADLARALAEAERRHDALERAYVARGEHLLREQLLLAEVLEAKDADDGAAARVETLLELAESRNRLEILDAEAAAARYESDQAHADLERVRAERDALRVQLAQALQENHRPARFRDLLPRRT